VETVRTEYLRVDVAVAVASESWQQAKSSGDARHEFKNFGQEQQEDRAMIDGTRGIGMSTTTFFAGLLAGIGAGLLLAPQSGARTRRQLENLAKDLQEDTSHMLGDAKTSIGKVIDQGKSLVG